jgi:cysteine desulfurase/selenocysteine lyase
MYDIESLRREEFPASANLTYLNHAGISPLPQRTKREVQSAIERLSEDPNAFFGKYALPAFASLQESLARYINADSPSEIVYSTTTSAALNAVAQAIDWRPGDNILFCDQEFPSNAYPWMSLSRDGVESRRVPSENGGLTLRQVEAHADDRTRAVTVSAIQFFSGHRADLVAIGRFCRERNILFIVDAIQAIGHMAFDVQAMNIDILATGGMKSLLALPGAGFIYVRDKVSSKMNPRLIHGNSTADYLHWLDYDLTPQPGAARLSSGTTNVPGVLSIGASLSLLNELGPANIDTHTTALIHYAIDNLTNEGYEVVTSKDTSGPIATFRSPFDSETTDRLIQFLSDRQVVVCKHLDAGISAYVRASVHCYNITADIDRLLEELRSFVS